MIKYCLSQWDKNKDKLAEYIKGNGKQLCTSDYKDLIKLVVDYIFCDEDSNRNCWDSNRITEIDNGDYQGTLLYLIANDSYQPSEFEYLMTYVGYGSCSGCDSLQAIQCDCDDNNELTDDQVKRYLMLCKDIVQNTIKPYNTGWRYSEEYISVEDSNK